MYDGDSSVNAAKALEFFNDAVFKQKAKKFVRPGTGYTGVVGQTGPVAIGEGPTSRHRQQTQTSEEQNEER
jgi:hypothetical protein